jgi:hypothetical protein
MGVDGVACTGEILPPPPGLKEVKDEALLNKALGATDKGNMCAGKVYEVTGKVTVYRVWNSAKSYTALGSWWAFTPPKGPVDTFRRDYVICPEWSDLDRSSSCTLKPGAHIVIGPGQSATCRDTRFPKSATNQIYIPNDSRKNEVYVDDCTSGSPWP